jgi:hypothetical protein
MCAARPSRISARGCGPRPEGAYWVGTHRFRPDVAHSGMDQAESIGADVTEGVRLIKWLKWPTATSADELHNKLDLVSISKQYPRLS